MQDVSSHRGISQHKHLGIMGVCMHVQSLQQIVRATVDHTTKPFQRFLLLHGLLCLVFMRIKCTCSVHVQ